MSFERRAIILLQGWVSVATLWYWESVLRDLWWWYCIGLCEFHLNNTVGLVCGFVVTLALATVVHVPELLAFEWCNLWANRRQVS